MSIQKRLDVLASFYRKDVMSFAQLIRGDNEDTLKCYSLINEKFINNSNKYLLLQRIAPDVDTICKRINW